MLEGTLERIEEDKGQEGKSLSFEMGYNIMSNLKFENTRYLFGDIEKSLSDSLSNLKIIFDMNNLRIEKVSEKHIQIKFDEEPSQHFIKFLMGLCDGILILMSVTGKVEESSGSGTVTITIRLN